MFVCFYLRYRHQVELVRFLNQFADPQMDMPPGWDKKVDQSGRVLYFHLPKCYFAIGHLHDGVILLLRPESFSFFLSYFDLVIPVRFL